MNTQKWLEAAQRYEAQRAQKAQELAACAKDEQARLAEEEDQVRTYQANVAKAVTELESFLASNDWHAARQLLVASDRHIVIDEENQGGGSGVVYYLDGNGLQKSIEAMGTWRIYANDKDIQKPQVSAVSAKEVVNLAIRKGAQPPQIMERIRRGLDSIAKQVL